MILAIQDTTELNYSQHQNKRGLGHLRGPQTQGALLHSVLSVSPDGLPLGILHHQMWARSERKTRKQQRLLAEKESHRWLQSLYQTEDLLSLGQPLAPAPAQPPQKAQLAPTPVQALRAIEIDQSHPGPPIEWILLTSLPIATLEQAQQMLEWYRYRWLIERYHYVLKSGCRIEHLQLESLERLQRAVATYAIVAWRLLWLTYLVRPLDRAELDLAADHLFETAEWQALYQHSQTRPCPPGHQPGLQECLRWLAQLGGHWGRKSDGDPGLKTLWRGLRRLRDLVCPVIAPVIAVYSAV